MPNLAPLLAQQQPLHKKQVEGLHNANGLVKVFDPIRCPKEQVVGKPRRSPGRMPSKL